MVMSRKFRVIGLLCILIIGNLSAQEQANQVNEKGQRTGLWLGYFKNSRQIEWRYYYKEDKLDSLQVSYYNDGQIKSRQTYKAGILNGVFETYFPNGKLHETWQYLNGKTEGIYKFYYKSGQLFREGEFHNDTDNGYSIR